MSKDLQEAPKAVQEMFAGLLRSFHNDNMKAEERAAEKDPLAHKHSKVFKDSSYRYFQNTNGRGSRVLFCYSVHRNVAGFFLGWREIHTRKKVKRDMWISRRVKKRCIEIARRRSEAFKRRLAAKKDVVSSGHGEA